MVWIYFLHFVASTDNTEYKCIFVFVQQGFLHGTVSLLCGQENPAIHTFSEKGSILPGKYAVHSFIYICVSIF